MSTSLRQEGVWLCPATLQSACEAVMLAPLEELCWAGGSPMFRASEEKGNVTGAAPRCQYFI